MAPEDIKKTPFRAGSLGLYAFTFMPFGLSNIGSHFCQVMEQCLEDQQFLTFLLYLNICILILVISTMLAHIEMAFTRLKCYNLKLNLRNVFLPVLHSWIMYFSLYGTSANLQNNDNVLNLHFVKKNSIAQCPAQL